MNAAELEAVLSLTVDKLRAVLRVGNLCNEIIHKIKRIDRRNAHNAHQCISVALHFGNQRFFRFVLHSRIIRRNFYIRILSDRLSGFRKRIQPVGADKDKLLDRIRIHCITIQKLITLS